MTNQKGKTKEIEEKLWPKTKLHGWSVSLFLQLLSLFSLSTHNHEAYYSGLATHGVKIIHAILKEHQVPSRYQ